MSTPYDGGPAFPQPLTFTPNGEAVTSGMYFAEGPGMSLRDYFAGKALEGLLATPNVEPVEGDTADAFCSRIARFSYRYADAMLAERNKASTEGE